MSHSEILSQFDESFAAILKQTVTVKTEVFESRNHKDVQERLDKILEATNQASRERYLNSDHEAILARLIMTIYGTEKELPVPAVEYHKSDSFFEILTNSRKDEVEEVFSHFDFYNQNPYREIAQRRLDKIKKRRDKQMR